MEAFFNSVYFTIALIVFDIVAVIAVICITYRWLFKRIFDLLVSILCIAALSPLYLFIAIKARAAKQNGEIARVLRSETFAGKKGKRCVLHVFETENENGERGDYGEWLYRTGLYKTARLFDLFAGRISLIGIKAMTRGECAFLDEVDLDRHIAKIGLIHPLVRGGNPETDYEVLLIAEKKYAWNFSFFGDCKIFFAWLVKKIRGEGNEYLGNTVNGTYAEWLYENGKITDADLAASKDKEL